MKSDIRYIIKKVIIGVLILLAYKIIDGRLGFVYNVNAKALYSHYTGSQEIWTQAPSSEPYVSGFSVPISGAPFKNSGYGYINFSFAIVSNSVNVDQPTPYEVLANYNIETLCDISSSSFRGPENFSSTGTIGLSTYTAKCPVYITDDNYLKSFTIRLAWPSSNGGGATIRTSNIVTFYRFDDNSEDAIKKQTEETKKINDSINDTNTDDAEETGGGFFDNFESDSHGLSGVITSPLRLLNSFTTASCQPLNFQLPIVHDDVSLPCMKSIYENRFGVFFSLWQLITTGLISYNVMINLYSKIHNLQNPNNDRIEVLNL